MTVWDLSLADVSRRLTHHMGYMQARLQVILVTIMIFNQDDF